MMADLQDRFRTMGDPSLPNIHALDDDRLRSMWVLHAAKLHLGTLWMTAAEISAVLRDVYGIDVSRQRVQGILGAEKGTVARRKVKGRRLFQLMQKGSDELTAVRSVIFVEPDSALSRLRDVQEILGDLQGPIRICDPYVSSATIDMLTHLDNGTDIKLLTMHIKDKEKPGLRRDMKAFVAEQKKPLEIRIGQTRHLHDRYMIDDDGMVIVGTSLNSIGLKQSFVVTVGEDIRASVLRAFEDAWAHGTTFT
jgi:hypothetical protein